MPIPISDILCDIFVQQTKNNTKIMSRHFSSNPKENAKGLVYDENRSGKINPRDLRTASTKPNFVSGNL